MVLIQVDGSFYTFDTNKGKFKKKAKKNIVDGTIVLCTILCLYYCKIIHISIGGRRELEILMFGWSE